MQLGATLGLKPEEQPVSVDDWREGVASGSIREVFACGTAAVVTPVGRLVWPEGEVGNSTAGEMTMRIRDSLIDVQYGRAADTNQWLHRLV